MPFAPLTKAERADWQELLAPADNARMTSAVMLFALSSLAIPFSLNHMVALLYVLYAVIFYYALTKSLPAVLLPALPAMLLFSVSSMFPDLPSFFTLPAIYAAALLGGVSGAFLMVQCRTPRRFLTLAIIPIGAYVITVLITADPARALFALIPTGLSLLVSYCFLTCRPLNSTVLLIATLVGGIAVVSWLATMALTTWPAGNPLIALTDTVRTGVYNMFKEADLFYATQGLDLAISDLAIRNVAALLGNILPGLFLALCLLFAFGTWRIFLRLIAAFGTLPRIPARLGAVSVSAVSATLFLCCYFISLVSGTVSVFGTVCQNLLLVLEPALILVGISSLFSRKEARSCLSTLLLVGVLVLFALNPLSALSLTALIGAVHVLLSRFLPHK